MKQAILLFSFICTGIIHSQNLDIDILKNINGQYTPNGGTAFKIITNSVNPISIGTPVGLLIGGFASKNKSMIWDGLEIASSTALNSIFTTTLKLSFRRDRPFVTYPNDVVKYTKAGSWSFPSGHTSTAFATATSLSLLYPKWYIIVPSYAWACSVGYSRMYLGAHYPSDVLFGAFLGTATSFGTHYLFKYIERKNDQKKKIML
jgi:membrane-associated phospholipid phosphatase